MTKYCMPQWTRWQITFSMLREVGIVLLQMNPLASAASHLRIQSWWLGYQRIFLFLQFHQTCGWNGLAVESPPRTAGFSATLEDKEHSSTRNQGIQASSVEWCPFPLVKTWLIYKVNYAIYCFIKFFKTVFSKCHVWCCTSIKQP